MLIYFESSHSLRKIEFTNRFSRVFSVNQKDILGSGYIALQAIESYRNNTRMKVNNTFMTPEKNIS